jgi:membrane-associated phospholipid phosphatase
MVRWEWVGIGYVSYLAAVALMPRFRAARPPALGAVAAAWMLLPLLAAWSSGMPDVVRALVPAPILLAGYWLSGRFYLGPMPGLERLLLRIDDVCLGATGATRWAHAGTWLGRYFELAYLLVYVVVPAGAIALVVSGHPDEVERFWATVMLAALASYGGLPWLQTRPPRLLEDPIGNRPVDDTLLRRGNLWLLGRGSIHANTIPSGHAATATAVALAVGNAVPEARAVLLVLAPSIVLATVTGRYHFVVDSIAGALVGFIAWALV